MDNQTTHETRMYEHYQRIEKENFELRKKLYKESVKYRELKKKYVSLVREKERRR